MTTALNEKAEALMEQAKETFEHWLFIGWQKDGKWVCTVDPAFSKEHMINLRDWLTRQI